MLQYTSSETLSRSRWFQTTCWADRCIQIKVSAVNSTETWQSIHGTKANGNVIEGAYPSIRYSRHKEWVLHEQANSHSVSLHSRSQVKLQEEISLAMSSAWEKRRSWPLPFDSSQDPSKNTVMTFKEEEVAHCSLISLEGNKRRKSFCIIICVRLVTLLVS